LLFMLSKGHGKGLRPQIFPDFNEFELKSTGNEEKTV
jgi:hypothetical protein